jgi:hypothetical protein
MNNHSLLIVAAVRAVKGRLAEAAGDDRGEINSNVAWAGLMLIVAVTVGGIILGVTQGAVGRFNFGF